MWRIREFFVRMSIMFFVGNVGGLVGGILIRCLLVLIASPEKGWTYSWAVTKTLDNMSGWYLEPGHTTLIFFVVIDSLWILADMLNRSSDSSSSNYKPFETEEQIIDNEFLDLYPIK